MNRWDDFPDALFALALQLNRMQSGYYRTPTPRAPVAPAVPICRVCGASCCYHHSQECPRCGEDGQPCACDREEA